MTRHKKSMWFVISEAIRGGWWTTLRLCLIILCLSAASMSAILRLV